MGHFGERVVEIIRQVPRGKVATYGQIAALAGSPRAAIMVGQILHNSSETLDLPWQRVINAQGYISTTCLEHPAALQATLLRHDGVQVTEQAGLFKIDLKKYRWDHWPKEDND